MSEAMRKPCENQVPGLVEVVIDLLSLLAVLPAELLESHERSFLVYFVKEQDHPLGDFLAGLGKLGWGAPSEGEHL